MIISKTNIITMMNQLLDTREDTCKLQTELNLFVERASSVLISTFQIGPEIKYKIEKNISVSSLSISDAWAPYKHFQNGKLFDDSMGQDVYGRTAKNHHDDDQPMNGEVIGLMYTNESMLHAFSKAKNSEAAAKVKLIIERSKKEVMTGIINDQLTAQMFANAIEAWARSESDDAPFECEQLLYRLFVQWKQVRQNALKPTTTIFNSVLNCWARSNNHLAATRSLQVLEWMEHLVLSGQLDAYPDIHTYNQVLLILSKSDGVGAKDDMMKVLRTMEYMYSKGRTCARPDSISYNCLLNAFSKIGTIESAQEAQKLLDRMHLMCDQGFYDVKPNTVSYGSVINALANSGHPDSPTRSYQILSNMIHLYQVDSIKNSSLRPNTCVFNSVLKCFAKSKQMESPVQAESILRVMDRLYADGLPVKPDAVTFSTVIHAWAKSAHPDSQKKVASLYKEMEDRYLSGDYSLKPNSITLNALISSFSRSGDKMNLHKADALMMSLIENYRSAGNNDFMPTTILFNSYVAMIAKSGTGLQSVQKVEHVISWMDDLHNKEKIPCKPDTITYNTCIDAWARACHPLAADRVEYILNHMYQLCEQGHENVCPDICTFNTCINAIAKSGVKNATGRAQRILYILENRFETGEHDMKPTTRTYTCLIDCLAKSGERGAAVRAERIFQRMNACGDPERQPNIITANAVINACAFSAFDDEKVEAFKIASRTYEWIMVSCNHPDSYTFTIMLSACSKLLHPKDTTKRMKYARDIFNTCRSLGQVNEFVVKKLHQLCPTISIINK